MVWKAIAKEMAKWHTLLPVVDLEFVVERGKGYEGLSDVGPNIWTRARGWIEGLGERTEEERKMKVDLEREFLYLVDKLGAKDVTIEQVRGSHVLLFLSSEILIIYLSWYLDTATWCLGISSYRAETKDILEKKRLKQSSSSIMSK